MMKPGRLLLLCAVFAAAVFQRAAAQAAPSGFRSQGSLVVQTEIGGQRLNIGGNIALEQRAGFIRIDMLSLSFPGADKMLNALASSQLFPQGGYTVVLDQARRTYTVWSPSKRTYFTSEPGATPAPSNPAGAAASTVGTTNDLLRTFSAARALKDYRVFSASITLTGHGTTNGHPTTGLSFSLKRQERTGGPLDVHGTLQLADDLDETPVQVVANVQGAGGFPPSTVRLDFTSVDRRVPPEADFAVPQGYTQAAHVGDVFGRILP